VVCCVWYGVFLLRTVKYWCPGTGGWRGGWRGGTTYVNAVYKFEGSKSEHRNSMKCIIFEG
jgi:hypothetical protein